MSDWRIVRLGDIVEAKYGKALPQERRHEGDVPVYGSNGIVGRHDKAITSGPTIVIGRKGGFGEVNYSELPCWPIDTTYFIDEPGPYRMEFLLHLLRSLGLTELDQSTAIPGLSRDQLYSIHVPIPTPEEQGKISRLITAAQVSQGRSVQHLKMARRAVARFRQAILAAACSGRLTVEWRDHHLDVEPADKTLERHRDERREQLGHRYKEPRLPDTAELPEIPESWAWAALPELGELGRGKSKHRPRNDPRLYGGPYPFIQTGDVARSGGKITAHSQTYNEAGLAQSKLWPERTVCITIAANIADSGLLTYPACFPDSVVGLIADDSIAVPEYVELFIRTVRRNLAAFAPATAQANINLAILAEVAVALPPVEEQREIVARAEAMYEVCAKVETAIQGATRRVERSSQAILARAFQGGLIGAES